MNNKAFIVPLALAAIVLTVFTLRRNLSAPAMNLRPSTALGEVLAEETARLVGQTGKLVAIGRATARDETSSAGEQIASFASAITRHGSLKLAGTEWLPRAPVGTMDLGGATPEQLLQVLVKNPDANGLVLFAGLPPLSPALAEQLKARQLKMVAVCGYSANVRRWLEAERLAMAVVPRISERPPESPAPKTAKDWFAQEFEIVTPETVKNLPY